MYQLRYVTRGQQVSVIMPIQQWKQILHELEELNDIRLYDEVKARKEPTLLLAEYRQKR